MSDEWKEPIVKNIKQCELCQGIVHRYNNMFKCEKCGAIEDLNTGIMTDCSYPKGD